MIIENFDPYTFDWSEILSEKAKGKTGIANTKSVSVGNMKVRQVRYSKNYLADHWCDKGHVVLVTQGQLILEHKNESVHTVNSGMTYIVGDNSMSHRARTEDGATAIIID